MKKLLLFLIVILLAYSVNASKPDIGYQTQYECIEIPQGCGTCTFNNVSSILYPNKTRVILDAPMTKRGTDYNYTFCTTDSLGTYYVNGVGDKDGVLTVWAYDFTVTENGREEISGILIAFFIIAFIGLSAYMVYTLLRNLAYIAEGETDISDVALSFLGYCVMWVFYYFSTVYFPKEVVLDLLHDLLYVTGFTHLILPIVSLFIVMVKNKRIPQ